MEELAALRAAVYAAPDDDAPRLVLADYLSQHGDPRGELIHVQCARESGADSDALAAREKKLLAALPRPPGHSQIGWHRGRSRVIVEMKTFTDEMLAFVAAEPVIERLSIMPCGGGGDSRWANVQRVIEAALDRVRELELGNIAWKMPTGPVTYIPFAEEFDDRDRCSAMLAALPPRPATLVELYAYEVELPATWQR